ncbi:MAG: DCC1-like thiol-disulfide oxidoreductase family protein [Bacteroidales bacterium]|nr:DCC1-like thiol-disulfide oxidoreductase family protein [Bacteroidales bacterium]MCF8454643.1 DCC1-like thiol-disulfide oxidoreductase family protein [Bacteroidales bacterium]
MKPEGQTYHLLYDAQCGFCSGIVRWISPSLSTNNVKLIDQHSSDGNQLIQKHFTQFDNNTVVLISQTKIFLKSDAIIELCRLTENAWRILVPFRFVPAGIRNWIYDRIARNRHWLFPKSSCDFES